MDCLSLIKDLYSTHNSVVALVQVYNIFVNFLTIIGNTVLIWALRRTQQTKTISYQFIIIMSASDLTSSLIGIVFLTLILNKQYHRQCRLKLATQLVMNAANYLSVLMIFLIALDRYLHMRYLERYSIKFTKKRGYWLVLISFAFALLISTCLALPLPQITHSIMKTGFFSISSLFLIAIITLYCKALHALRRKEDQIARSIINQNRALGKAAKRVSICFLILTGPIILLHTLDGINNQVTIVDSSVLNLCIWFAFITFLANGFCSSVIFISLNIKIQRLLRRVVMGYWNSLRSAVGAIETGAWTPVACPCMPNWCRACNLRLWINIIFRVLSIVKLILLYHIH